VAGAAEEEAACGLSATVELAAATAMTVAGAEDGEPAPEEGEGESTLDDPSLTAELPDVPLIGAAEEGLPESVLDGVGLVDDGTMTIVEADDPPPIGTKMAVLEPAVAEFAWLEPGVTWAASEEGVGLLDWVATETCVLAKPTNVVGTKDDSPWDEPALVDANPTIVVGTNEDPP